MEFYTGTTTIVMRLLLHSRAKWQLEVQYFVIINMLESECSYCGCAIKRVNKVPPAME
jgi:hypothetical protein